MPIFRLMRFANPGPTARWRWLAAMTLGAALLLLAARVGVVLVSGNFRAVIPGRVYRSAQPSRADFALLAERYRIRTVVNLRGVFRPAADYAAHRRNAEDAGLVMEDVSGVWRSSLPPPAAVQRLVAVLDAAPGPTLLHCSSGSDRTGWAAGVAVLLFGHGEVAAARGQLSLWYGHWRYGRAHVLDDFFVRYNSWLEATHQAHAPERFRQWVNEVYRGPEG